MRLVNRTNALILALSFLILFFCQVSTALITYTLGGSISSLQFWLSLGITLPTTITAAWLTRQKNPVRTGLLLYSVMVVVLALGMVISGLFIDASFDGQGYHQAGIVALDKGWNPLRQQVDDLTTVKLENKLWVQAYPHANDIMSLEMYKATGNLEQAKAYTALWIIVAVLITGAALLALGLNVWLTPVLVLITMLNPVNIMQSLTFGLDSQYYSMLLCAIGLSVLIFKKIAPALVYPAFIITSILMINNKLTSVEGLVIVGGMAGIYMLARRHYLTFFTYVVTLIAGLAIGGLVYGYQPFVTNFLTHKSPFYPVVISSATNDRAYNFLENRPSNFEAQNNLALFVDAIFFRSNGYFYPPKDQAQYKLPFTFTNDEVNSLIYLGPKEGGFGVLFSGIIVLLALILLRLFFLRRRYIGHRWESITLGLGAVCIILSCVIHPINSDYRYIPQLWLVLPIILWLSWKFHDGTVVTLNVLVVLVVIVNAIFVVLPVIRTNVALTRRLDARLHQLADMSRKHPITVNFGLSEGNEFLLKQYHVDFQPSAVALSSFACKGGTTVQSLLAGIGSNVSVMCTQTSEAASDLLLAAWEHYKDTFITDGMVVNAQGENKVTSEAQSYALMQAVWMDDKKAFDSVWKWTVQNLQQNDGLLTWKWQPDTAADKLDTGAAPDADEDSALALLFAYQKWHNQADLTDGLHILDGMWNKEVVQISGTPYLTAGNNWADSPEAITVNPSYLSPASYKIFALADPAHNWAKLADTSYTMLNLCTAAQLDKTHGDLPPNWCQINKANITASVSASPKPTGTEYGYDAFRTPYRIALDYLWNQDARAQVYLASLTKLGQQWGSEHKLCDVYLHDGVCAANQEKIAAYGGDLGYFIVTNPAIAKEIYMTKILSQFSQDSMGAYWADPNDYYGQNWAWFGTALYENKAENLWPAKH